MAFRGVLQGGRRLPVVSAAIAPSVHESAVFVWSPLMVLTAWEMWLAGRILPRLLAVLGLSTCAIFVLHNQAAAVLQINAAPLTAAVKEEIINIQMGQTLPSALRHMAGTWAEYRRNGLLWLVLFTLPAVLAIGAYAAIRRLHWAEVGVLLLAALLPVLILSVAWNFSRFIVYTNFAAGLAIAYWESGSAHGAAILLDGLGAGASDGAASTQPTGVRVFFRCLCV